MRDEIKERLRQLCERAAVEQDPNRLLELTEEIGKLLDEKERLKQKRSSTAGSE